MFAQSRTERKITREGAREVCCQDKEEARGWALGAWRNIGQVCLTTPNRNWDLTPRLGEWVQGPSLIKTIHHYQSLLIYLFNPPFQCVRSHYETGKYNQVPITHIYSVACAGVWEPHCLLCRQDTLLSREKTQPGSKTLHMGTRSADSAQRLVTLTACTREIKTFVPSLSLVQSIKQGPACCAANTCGNSEQEESGGGGNNLSVVKSSYRRLEWRYRRHFKDHWAYGRRLPFVSHSEYFRPDWIHQTDYQPRLNGGGERQSWRKMPIESTKGTGGG